VFSKGKFKSIGQLQLKFTMKVNMEIINVCLIFGNLKKSLSIKYLISIICHTCGFRGF
jgi:hypothetical protein